MSDFWNRRRERWISWWHKPLRWWERLSIIVASTCWFAIAGAVVGFFTGAIPFPTDNLFFDVGRWSAPAAVIGALFGYIYPKAAFCLMYPFALIGIDINVT